MRYTFDSITLASGVFSMSFITNDGISGVESVGGNYLLTLASLKESIEVNGVGGFPRLDNMEVEVYDRNSVFHDKIFTLSTVTRVYADLRLTVAGTEYGLFYGMVDLRTVEYPSMYLNSTSGEEFRRCRFSIVSVFGGLQEVSVASLRSALNASGYLQAGTGGKYYVYLRDVIAFAYSFIDTSRVIHVSMSFPYRLGYTGVVRSPGDCLMYFKLLLPPALEAFAPYWREDVSKSLINLGSVDALLNSILGTFLLYATVTYSSSNDSFYVDVKGRYDGSLLSLADDLIESVEKRAMSYDGIRVATNNTYLDYKKILIRGHQVDSADEQFNLLKQKFNFENKFSFYEYPLFDHNGNPVDESSRDTELTLWDSDAVNKIRGLAPSGSSVITGIQWNAHLLKEFSNYWGTVKYSSVAPYVEYNVQGRIYERTYRGVGIGVSAIRLLDKLLIGDGEYVIYDIERDLVKNTIRLSCSEY